MYAVCVWTVSGPRGGGLTQGHRCGQGGHPQNEGTHPPHLLSNNIMSLYNQNSFV